MAYIYLMLSCHCCIMCSLCSVVAQEDKENEQPQTGEETEQGWHINT